MQIFKADPVTVVASDFSSEAVVASVTIPAAVVDRGRTFKIRLAGSILNDVADGWQFFLRAGGLTGDIIVYSPQSVTVSQYDVLTGEAWVTITTADTHIGKGTFLGITSNSEDSSTYANATTYDGTTDTSFDLTAVCLYGGGSFLPAGDGTSQFGLIVFEVEALPTAGRA